MTTVFADTCYWLALMNPRDHLHDTAVAASKELGQSNIVTSEMVLVELLNGLSRYGHAMRNTSVATIQMLRKNPEVEIVPQTSELFQDAFERYASRPDQAWGITDCASFIIMEQGGISHALTADHHFEQAGFFALMSK